MKLFLQKIIHRLGYHVSRHPDEFHRDLQALLQRLQSNVVLDVGGQHGHYGAMLRELGYRGYILSFEPVPENFAVLSARCRKDPRWRAYRMALGSVEGEHPINVTGGSDLHSFLQPSAFGREQFGSSIGIARVEQVRVRRLETILPECLREIPALALPSLFLKLDTQGYDFEVLAGAGAWLREIRGMQIEIPVQPIYEGVGDFSQAIAKLYGAGFFVTSLAPIFRDRHRRVGEFDCLAERRQPRAGEA